MTGYWYFYDRYIDPEPSDRYDPTGVGDRVSLNFTLAMLDTDNGVLYVWKVDT